MSTSARSGGAKIFRYFFWSCGGIAVLLLAGLLYRYTTIYGSPSFKETLINKTEPRTLDDVTFQMFHPSPGTLQITAPVALTIRDSQGVISLRADQTISIQPGMKVIFYDSPHVARPYKGEIITVTESQATVALPEDIINLPDNTPLMADIVIFENVMAKRVPNMAIVADNQGQRFIWKAVPSLDGTTQVEKVFLDPTAQFNQEFTDIGNVARVEDFIILNPDPRLGEGMTISSTVPVQVNGPVSDPQEIALQQLNDRIEREMIESLPDTVSGNSACSGAPALSLPLKGGMSTPVETP